MKIYILLISFYFVAIFSLMADDYLLVHIASTGTNVFYTMNGTAVNMSTLKKKMKLLARFSKDIPVCVIVDDKTSLKDVLQLSSAIGSTGMSKLYFTVTASTNSAYQVFVKDVPFPDNFLLSGKNRLKIFQQPPAGDSCLAPEE